MEHTKLSRSKLKKEIIALEKNKTINQVSGYYSKSAFGRVPESSSGLKWIFNIDGRVYDIYELFKDTTFSACHDARITGAFANKYKFFGNESDKRLLKDLKFDRQITRVFGELVTFNMMFAQILTKNGKLSQVRTYDTPTMDFGVDVRNNIVGYYQILNAPPISSTSENTSRQFWDILPPSSLSSINAVDSQQQFIFFNQEEMFHFSVNDISSSLFPSVTSATLFRAVRLKFLIMEYMTTVFVSNDFQTTINIPNMSNKDKTVFMKNIIDAQRNKSKKLILEGFNIDIKDRKEMQFFTYLIQLWDMMDNEIMKGLKCKRVEASTSAEGRSDNVVVSQFVSLRVKQDQNNIKSIVEEEIFKRGNIDLKIIFGIGDEDQKVIIQNLSTLASIHPLKAKKIEELLKDKGIFVPKGIFDEEAMANNLQNQAEKNGPQNESRRNLDNRDNARPQKLEATRDQAKDVNTDKLFRRDQ